jgi:hypothetical protein
MTCTLKCERAARILNLYDDIMHAELRVGRRPLDESKVRIDGVVSNNSAESILRRVTTPHDSSN